MSMTDWARREVEIACKREAPNRKDGEWDYGCACYESALKAYLSLMNDEHSGGSFEFTAGILKRLLEAKPLTPIRDEPESWNVITYAEDGSMEYQCRRMSSLFKHVSSDGTVKYSDVRRYYCIEAGTRCTYTCGLEGSILDELYPIAMPYYPQTGYYVFISQEFLTDRKNGDFDTKHIHELKCPDGTRIKIHRYFADDGEGWREISFNEFSERVKLDKYRIEIESEKKANAQTD